MLNPYGVAIVMTFFACLSRLAYADTADEIAELKARLAALEAAQKTDTQPLSEKITFSGIIEIEAAYTDSEDFSGETSSDIVLATAELSIEANIAENISGNLTLLYEDDGDEDLDVDVATILFDHVGDTAFLLGQTYLPFGAFETHLVNDTLVLELAETRETTAVVTYSQDIFSASAYVFNGDTDNDNNIENYGVSLNIGNAQFSAGVDFISNVAETDGIFSVLEDAGYDPAVADSDEDPNALILRGVGQWGVVRVIAEYLEADKLKAADWGITTDFAAEALQLEVGVTIDKWTLATALQTTEESGGILPEKRVSIGAGTDVAENISIALEIWRDEDYNVARGGSGEEATSAVVQIAASF